MADRIVAAVRRQRLLFAGGEDDLHGLIARYATAKFYRQAEADGEQLRRRIVKLLAAKHLPRAAEIGKSSARPILDRLGGRDLVARGNRWRGSVLADFKRYHRSNLHVLETELAQEVGTLKAEIRSAFARASRDGVARKQLIADLVTADRAELRQLAKVRRDLAAAQKRLMQAEASGSQAAIKAARKEITRNNARIRGAKSFLARFETRVQGRARDAARREGQRAQYAAFRSAGFTGEFVWVAVNGSDACPSCQELHGRTGSQSDWAGRMPGDGHTYCGSACMCQLVPKEYAEGNESLRNPVNPYRLEHDPQGPEKKEPQSSLSDARMFTAEQLALSRKALSRQASQRTVYAAAKQAKAGFGARLNDVATALKAEVFVEDHAGAVAFAKSKSGALVDQAVLKGAERAAEKVAGEYGGDWRQLGDVLRATVAVDRVGEVPGAVRAVVSNFEKAGWSMASAPGNRFGKPFYGGYRDVKLNFRAPNGLVTEVQVNTKPLVLAKEQGHRLYERTRTIKDKLRDAGHITDVEKAELFRAETIMKQLYEEAFEKSQ